jgi:CRISPR-associated protein Cas5d
MKPTEILEAVFWGDMGMFTRPEFRSERVSYLIPPPSQARGMVEAIYWKPQVETIIEEIQVLRPLRTVTYRFNEVGQMPGEGTFVADSSVAGTHTQTSYVCVRDPMYKVLFRYYCKDGNPSKHAEIFNRRLEKGQTYRHLCMGRKRFQAFARPVEEGDKPIPDSMPLGVMIHDFPKDDRTRPFTFDAMMWEGRIEIPFDRALRERGVEAA